MAENNPAFGFSNEKSMVVDGEIALVNSPSR